MSYSQNNEDIVVSEYFGNRIGMLLDIGANNGWELSNSKLLIDKGWCGHLVEPSDAFHVIETNERIKRYPYAISNKSGVFDFYDCPDTLLSTTNEWLAGAQNPNYTVKQVNVITFAELMAMIYEPVLNYITIDAEGEDWNILQQINLSALGVECLCIEHGNSTANYNRIKGYCAHHGLERELLYNFENLILAV